jgi:hypothetical protein
MSRTSKVVVAAETAPVVALANPKGLNPLNALDGWAKTQNIDAKVEKIVRGEVEGIMSDTVRIRQTFYSIGQHLVNIRTAIGESSKWIEFRDKVLPSLGISRTNAFSLIGRVETMQVKFPNPTVRNLLVESTNGRGIVDSQTGNMTDKAQKALDSVGQIPESATEKDATAYVAKFVEELKKLSSTPRTSDGETKTKYDRKRDQCISRFVNYKKSMDEYKALDAIKAAHGAAEDIEDLFLFFINCKPTPEYVEKLSNRLATLLKRSGLETKAVSK